MKIIAAKQTANPTVVVRLKPSLKNINIVASVISEAEVIIKKYKH